MYGILQPNAIKGRVSLISISLTKNTSMKTILFIYNFFTFLRFREKTVNIWLRWFLVGRFQGLLMNSLVSVQQVLMLYKGPGSLQVPPDVQQE